MLSDQDHLLMELAAAPEVEADAVEIGPIVEGESSTVEAKAWMRQ